VTPRETLRRQVWVFWPYRHFCTVFAQPILILCILIVQDGFSCNSAWYRFEVVDGFCYRFRILNTGFT